MKAAAASTLLDVQPATWRHLHGWTTTLPLATDALRMRRTMDTAGPGRRVPARLPDLPAPLPGDPATTGGVLYGVNPDLHRGRVVGPVGAATTTTPSSWPAPAPASRYFVKLEVLRNLYQGVQVAVIDPEDEYLRLADAVGGTVVRLGAPGVRINPLDLPVGDTRPDVLTRRGLFLHTLIAVLLGRQRAAARRNGPPWTGPSSPPTATPGSPPTRPPTTGPRRCCATWPPRCTPTPTRPRTQLAARLAPWVVGIFADLFDGPTTTRPDGHLVVWSLRHLPDELRTVGTLLALDAIWRSVDLPTGSTAQSRPRGRRLVVVDEAWLLMRDGEGARFLFRMAKAARKRNAGLTVVTQDAADVLATDLGLAVVVQRRHPDPAAARPRRPSTPSPTRSG